MDLMQLMDTYGSEKACREALAGLRWPDGVTCPRCASDRHSYDSERYVWDCYSCGYQFSVMSGTVLHDTKLPLRKWFMATLLMVEAKKGISAMQLKRTLGLGSYRTAWYLCHRIRAAMVVADPEPLSGTVEMDETFIGGKPRYSTKELDQWGRPSRAARWREAMDRKTIVLGALERGGDIRLRVAPNRSGPTIRSFAEENLSPDTANIYSDDWHSYRALGDADTKHEHVNHSAKEYVRGDIHTNGIESAWSLFKRSIVGSYHQLSEKHLDAYLDEFEWRFNNRENPFLFRDTLLKLLTAESLPYQVLICDQKLD